MWLVILAFGLRLLWVLAVPSRPVGDFALYRESATYLIEHGRLDPEFIYMPGYVFILAAVQWIGGGLLAQKMIGVAAGTLLVASSSAIADRLFGRRAGITAAALLAVWPAGIAVASVTGTDVPSAALVASAIFVLVASAPGPARSPYSWRAAVAAGFILGFAAWIRAVAVPLAGLSLFIWKARGLRWRPAAAHALVGVAAALFVLLPWGARNFRTYGDFFFTDTHGGHTALVGANPNSDGTYSRSLNLMFTRGTGFKLFEAPARHQAADAAAYRLAKQWTWFQPAYAVGLLGAKADRLLAHERNLMYWPVFRAGVLNSGLIGVPGTGDAVRAWFERHRSGTERVVDGFWWSICALFAAGLSLAFLRLPRGPAWLSIATLTVPVALAAMYTLFFAEVRYHLAIAPLLFPHAAFALTWLGLRARDRFRGDGRALAVMCVGLLGAFAVFTLFFAFCDHLRARYRWAVSVCQVAGPSGAYAASFPGTAAPASQLCRWRNAWPKAGTPVSPLRGVWNGVGLKLRVNRDDAGDLWAATETVLALGPGRFRVQVTASRFAPTPNAATPASASDETAPSLSVALRAGDTIFARSVVSAPRKGQAETVVSGVLHHARGPLRLAVEVEAPTRQSASDYPHAYAARAPSTPTAGFPGSASPLLDGETLWISDLSVERFPALEIIAPR